jgi:outer membrane protein OmpA-like peptidoglycan-associated protein
MQIAFITICLSSVLVMGGCASGNFQGSELPSLKEQSSYQIIQVNSNHDHSVLRDNPYFIVCKGNDCPLITKKTPLSFKPVKTALAMNTKGRTVDGKNTTYLKKTVSILEQFRVHFDYASAKVSDTYQTLLKSFVKDYPHQQKTIRVTGYTDSDSKPDGTVGNEWLALERAISVKNELIDLGYPDSQVLLEAKFLCCYIDSNESEAGRHNNRRAEISLINTLHN